MYVCVRVCMCVYVCVPARTVCQVCTCVCVHACTNVQTFIGYRCRMTVVGSAFWMAPEMLNGNR